MTGEESKPDGLSEGTGAPGAPFERRRVPIGELLGFRVTEAAPGRAVVSLKAGPHHANPLGTLHGGVLCDIADAAMGTAFVETIGEDESFTTLELKINFLRPVWEAELQAVANVVHRGKTLGYVECAITDDRGRMIAKASSTCLVLRGAQAAGR